MPDEAAPTWRNVTEVRAFRPLDTSAMFTGAVPDDALSPIDQFIGNTEAINRIYLNAAYTAAPDAAEATAPVAERTDAASDGPTAGCEAEACEEAADVPEATGGDGDGTEEAIRLSAEPERIPAELGALAVLGYMSAVESYFRALIRKLIEVDDHVRSLVEPMDVSYGAACHHTPALLPEALMEHLSFAGEKTVVDVLRSLLGIKGNLPREVAEVLKEFRKVCEIRHCCVHRFGRLGSKGAMTLGIREHGALLELPFAPTVDGLQSVAALLHTFVKTLNNFIYRSLLERIDANEGRQGDYAYDWRWMGRWEEDADRFRPYYGLFASTRDTPPSPDMDAMYGALAALVARQRSRRRGARPPRPVAEV